MISTTTLARLSGASYRQIDHWKRNGVVRANPRAFTGSGTYERWDDNMVDVVRALAAVQDGCGADRGGGLPASILRQIVEHHRDGELELAPGVVITWPVAAKVPA